MAPRRPDRTEAAVVGVALLALAARLAFLGRRAAHWDEARVGYWILRYVETGNWQYFPILHGPFLFQVNRVVYEVLGPTDAAGRVVVAVLGGLLVPSALAFRGRLRDDETVALAVLLAADPLLLYYSRFMRNDLPLAAFMFVGFGLLVRAVDTDRRRYLLAAAPVLALGFTTKENAVLYLACWAGAAAAVAAYRWRSVPEATPRASLRIAARWARRPGALALAGLSFLAVVVFFYAPRGDAWGKPTLGAALADPTLWPAVALEATVGSAVELVELWLLGGLQDFIYPQYLLLLVGLTLASSFALVALAGYGLHLERRDPRPLVAFAAVWAALTLFGYPLAVDLMAGWTPVHLVVPLAFPAAVGLAALARRAQGILNDGARGVFDEGIRGIFDDDPRPGARAAAVALVLLAGQVAVAGAATSYLAPSSPENPLGQPSQPGADVREVGDAMAAVAGDNAGVDVAYYGPYFAGGLHRRYPLPWYLQRSDVGAEGPARVRTVVAEDRSALGEPPPVVVTLEYHRAEIEPVLSGYACFRVELDPWSDREPGGPRTDYLVYIEEAALDDYGSTLASQRCG